MRRQQWVLDVRGAPDSHRDRRLAADIEDVAGVGGADAHEFERSVWVLVEGELDLLVGRLFEGEVLIGSEGRKREYEDHDGERVCLHPQVEREVLPGARDDRGAIAERD